MIDLHPQLEGKYAVSSGAHTIVIEVWTNRMKMLLFVILLLFVGQSRAYDQCRGNKQNVMVPQGYDKDVPDASSTGNATDVHVAYGIKHLRKISEAR